MPNVLDGPESCLDRNFYGVKIAFFLNFKFLPLISAIKKPKPILLMGSNESARQADSNDADPVR